MVGRVSGGSHHLPILITLMDNSPSLHSDWLTDLLNYRMINSPGSTRKLGNLMQNVFTIQGSIC